MVPTSRTPLHSLVSNAGDISWEAMWAQAQCSYRCLAVAHLWRRQSAQAEEAACPCRHQICQLSVALPCLPCQRLCSTCLSFPVCWCAKLWHYPPQSVTGLMHTSPPKVYF